MNEQFFEHPILNSPYAYPKRHWELDASGQPTQKITEARRRAEFITPIPKSKKQKGKEVQQDLVFDEGLGLSTQEQRYNPIPVINDLRRQVDAWRTLPNVADWKVTPAAGCFNIGGITSSTASAHFFAKLRPLKLQSG